MKKIIITVILGILLAGITTASAEEKLEKYEWMQEKLDINPFDFLYMQGESILYNQDEDSEDDQFSNICFYEYNIKERTRSFLGKIKDWYITSADYVINKDKLYVWYQLYNSLNRESDSYNVIENLYCIDYKEKTVKSLREEKVYQQLIFQDTFNNNLVFMKGNFDDNGGTASIQSVPFFNLENGETKTLMKKKYNQKEESGEWIEQFCAEDELLYVIVRDFSSGTENKIEVYDTYGNCVKEIFFDCRMSELMSEKNIVTFEVLGEYAFCKMTSGSSLILKLSGKQTEILIEWDGNDLVDISMNADSDDAVLFACASGRIWKWELNAHRLCELDVPFQQIDKVAYDGKQNAVIVTAKEMRAESVYLVNLDKMLTKHIVYLY